jgi:hypothetical protein
VPKARAATIVFSMLGVIILEMKEVKSIESFRRSLVAVTLIVRCCDEV